LHDPEQIEAYAGWPSPDWFDFGAIEASAKR